VRAATWIYYPDTTADALDGPAGLAVRRPPPQAEVWLRIPEGIFSHYVGPLPIGGRDRIETPWGLLRFDGRGGVRVRIDPDPAKGRAACVWEKGRLEVLATPGF
jgi:hypothetical protein